MLEIKGVIEALAERFGYSQLIRLAGVSRTIRKWITETQKWKHVLDDWVFSTAGLKQVDRNLLYRVFRVKNDYFLKREENEDTYTLKNIEVSWGSRYNPSVLRPCDIFIK